jgi:hypothetical protein
MAWQITQLSDQGTRNPIVARLKLGLLEVIDMAQISEDKRRLVTEHCFEIGKDLLLAEKAAVPLMNELREIELRLESEGPRTQDNDRVVETPGVMHLDDARVFLKYAKSALNTLSSAMGVILDGNFRGPHFHKIRDHAIQKLGADHHLSKLLIEDQGWIKEILDLRDEDEHPKSGKPFIRGFNITRTPDGMWLADVPRFFNGAPVLNNLQVYSHNLLTFSEDMIALSLADFFSPVVELQEIPEADRNPDKPVRFRFGLKEKFRRDR